MTKYLFLDGGCLRARLKDISARYCAGASLDINWWGPSAGYRKVFYYDALPSRKPNQAEHEFETERKAVEELHAKLANIDRFRVNEGDTRYRKGRGLEQKKVDVMIAVDMMIHTIRRNMTEAALLAGDADFTPLLNALSNEGMFVTLIHPPKASNDLLAAADARRPMSVMEIYNWLDHHSQAKLGAFPTISLPSASHDANCQQVWASEDERDIQVFFQLVDNELWVSWPREGDTRVMLRGGSWKNSEPPRDCRRP